MIYLRRCRAKYIHDFDDYPCKKCNGIILENEWENTNKFYVFALLVVIIVRIFI